MKFRWSRFHWSRFYRGIVGERVVGVVRAVMAVALLLGLVVPSGASAGGLSQGEKCRRMNNFDVCGRFLEEWSKYGGDQPNLYVSGFPLTARRAEISLTNGSVYEMQWFERARFEWHPENAGTRYDVLLGLLGTALAEGRGTINPSTGKLRNASDQAFVGIPKPGDTGAGKLWFPETRHTISGKVLEYWKRYGGIGQFGFPLSEPFQEVSQADGKAYTVQYFQRNRFELHPEKPAPYEVELGLLGAEQYRATPVPGSALPIAPPKDTATTKDTLTVAISREPSSLFPLFEGAPVLQNGNPSVAQVIGEAIFDGLVNRDGRDNLFPEIAWYVPTIENGGAFFTGTGVDRHLVVKYKLRRGIKWSDGAEVTSRDALYHFKLVMDPNALVQDRSTQERVANVDAPDKYTVIYNFMSAREAGVFYDRTLEKEHFAYLKGFAEVGRPVVDGLYSEVGGVLPEHILGPLAADRIVDSGFGRNPVGSGPFMVQGSGVGQIELVQNPNYNLTDKPLLKRIVFKVIPDVTQVVAQLRSGDIDAATSDLFPAPTPSGARIEALGTLGSEQKVEYAPNRVWERIDLNVERPYFADKGVRQAIAYAIDREEIVEKVMFGRGRTPVMDTFIPAGMWGSMQNVDFGREWGGKFGLRRYGYDKEKAEQMLDGAGWVRDQGSGIRGKGGVKMSFTYAYAGGSREREEVARMVAGYLDEVGMEVELKAVGGQGSGVGDQGSVPEYVARREFDMYEHGTMTDVDVGGMEYSIGRIPEAGNGYVGSNYSGWRNGRFDELARLEEVEVDRGKGGGMLAEMQAIWSEEVPSVGLYGRATIEVHKVRLAGWETSGVTKGAMYKVGAMYFK